MIPSVQIQNRCQDDTFKGIINRVIDCRPLIVNCLPQKYLSTILLISDEDTKSMMPIILTLFLSLMKNLVLHPGRGMRILVHYVVALQVFLPVDYRLSSCIICLSRGRLMTRNELRETFL